MSQVGVRNLKIFYLLEMTIKEIGEVIVTKVLQEVGGIKHRVVFGGQKTMQLIR